MEFKTKATLVEWANDQTMAEIAAYYNGLPGVKPVKKFESRDVAVTRIWAVLSPDKPQVARKPKAPRKSASSGRTSKPRKASKARATVSETRIEASRPTDQSSIVGA
jgi:hypothetical protein